MSEKKAKVKHTPGDLAEAYVYPVNLTPAQKKAADNHLKAARAKVQSEMTAADKLMADVLQFGFD